MQDPLIGTPAKPLEASQWINSAPINLDELKGKVVLIRWWTGPDCSFCKASSVALNEWHKQHAKQGLQVIGMYHHKTDTPLTLESVQNTATAFGFTFPIGIDEDWQTLNSWWLFEKRDWTSVSFLLDKNGTIQHIHPGGEYIKGDTDHQALDEKIRTLLEN